MIRQISFTLILLLFNLQMFGQNKNKSEEYYLKSKESYFKKEKDNAVKFLKLAIETSNSDKAKLYFELGNLFSEYNNLKEAASNYQKAIDSGYKLNQIITYKIGSAYYFTQNYTKAIEYLEKSLELGNTNSDVTNNLAWTYSEIGDFQKAIKYFTIAYNINPNYVNNINNLGYAYYLNNELNVAEEWILKAKTMDNSNSFVYRNLGLIEMKRNNKEQACKFYTQALEHKIIEKWGKLYVVELLEYCESSN